MRRLLPLLALVALLTAPNAAMAQKGDRNTAAAATLSMMFPGTGEWYNSGYNYGFPLWECILGYICPCVRFASVFDAAEGKRRKSVRINFWTAP